MKVGDLLLMVDGEPTAGMDALGLVEVSRYLQ